MKCLVFAGTVLLLLAFAQAPVFALQTVAADGSGDHLTIQAGLDAAAVGEEVQVIDSGTYTESLNVNGEILTSVPAGATIDAGGGNGAIVWGDLDATIDGFTITNAGANGVHIDGSPADVQIKNCTISGGTGVNFGAGAATATITNCTITATAHGVLFNAGEGHTCTIIGSSITSSGEHAVTLYRSATVTITDSFLNNCSQSGIRVDGSDTGVERVVTLTNTQINNNGYCIGIFRKGTYTFTNCSISGNGIDGPDPNWQGAFFVDGTSGGATFNFTDTSISNNFQRGLFTGRPITLNMDGCTLQGNGSRALWVDDFSGNTTYGQNVTITNTSFLNNGGAGLIVPAKEFNSTATVTDCTFTGNAEFAATIEASNSQSGKTILADVERNIFRDGTANGGAILGLNVVAAGSKVINNLFDQGGTGLVINNTSVDVYNNTFTGTVDGMGIDVTATGGKTVNIENNVIAGHDTGVFSTDPTGLENVTVDYNLVQSVTANFDANITPQVGVNNLLDISPEFLQSSPLVGMGDYRLALSSPAVDAGIDLGITVDLKGNTRDATPDLGAYEYESPVNIVISDWTVY